MWRWNEFYWCLNCWNKQRKPIVDGIVNHPLEGIMSFATKKTMILSIQCLYKWLYLYNITFNPTVTEKGGDPESNRAPLSLPNPDWTATQADPDSHTQCTHISDPHSGPQCSICLTLIQKSHDTRCIIPHWHHSDSIHSHELSKPNSTFQAFTDQSLQILAPTAQAPIVPLDKSYSTSIPLSKDTQLRSFIWLIANRNESRN
jgi:hypothetical protein